MMFWQAWMQRLALARVQSAVELRDFLEAAARRHQPMPAQAALEARFAAVWEDWTAQERREAQSVLAAIAAALYADRPADIEDLKARCRRILPALARKPGARRSNAHRLGDLNPG